MAALLINNIDTATRIFGRSAAIYGQILNGIGDEILDCQYHFVDSDQFENGLAAGAISREGMGRIYWIEKLQQVQLVSVLTLVRTARWVDSCAREYDAGSISSWAGACRSLVECVGDSGDALQVAGLSLAENAASIARQIDGNGAASVSTELENALIHFTQARHFKMKEVAPENHKAKMSAEYIKTAESMGLPHATEFYSKLCQLNHPAEPSMAHLYNPSDDGFRLTLALERPALQKFIYDNKETLQEVLSYALNPALIALRVVGAFGVSEVPPQLKMLDLSAIKQWGRVVTAMRAANLDI